jgi:TRAP-type uncharacterized transport system fused permease subunit
MSDTAQSTIKHIKGSSEPVKDRHSGTSFGFRSMVIIVLTLIGIGASVFHLFGFNIYGHVMWPRAYYSLIMGCFLPVVFITIPYKKNAGTAKWFDIAAAVLCMIISAFFFINAENIEYEGWEYVTPPLCLVMAIPICFLVFEAARRASGGIFFIVCLIFSVFPLFTEFLPGILRGVGFSFLKVIPYYV